MNLVIHQIGSKEITHFIRDARQTGPNDYAGDAIRLHGIKPLHWAIIWTLDEVEPIRDHEGNPTGRWDATVDQITPCDQYHGQPVESEADIDRITCKEIAQVYPIEEEVRLLRKQAMGKVDPKEWADYVAFIESKADEGRAVKLNISKGAL